MKKKVPVLFIFIFFFAYQVKHQNRKTSRLKSGLRVSLQSNIPEEFQKRAFLVVQNLPKVIEYKTTPEGVIVISKEPSKKALENQLERIKTTFNNPNNIHSAPIQKLAFKLNELNEKGLNLKLKSYSITKIELSRHFAEQRGVDYFSFVIVASLQTFLALLLLPMLSMLLRVAKATPSQIIRKKK